MSHAIASKVTITAQAVRVDPIAVEVIGFRRFG
jgi:hypothetical protein